MRQGRATLLSVMRGAGGRSEYFRVFQPLVDSMRIPPSQTVALGHIHPHAASRLPARFRRRSSHAPLAMNSLCAIRRALRGTCSRNGRPLGEGWSRRFR